jgi:hypothetical protein
MKEGENTEENVWFKKFNVSISLNDEGIVAHSNFEPEIPRRKVIVEKYILKRVDLGLSFPAGVVSVYGEEGLKNARGTDSITIWEE